VDGEVVANICSRIVGLAGVAVQRGAARAGGCPPTVPAAELNAHIVIDHGCLETQG
jgi:hypothetical protein